MLISLIIPAHNEERYITATLESVQRAVLYSSSEEFQVNVIVVDNDSNDATAEIATSMGATVVREVYRSVARARNRGASSANDEILVFLDADTLIPERLFSRIAEVMENALCFGGTVDISYCPSRRWVQLYLYLWRYVGRIAGMAQGATQFCRREIFRSLAGYDESLYMGEDVDFYWRLTRLAKERHGYVSFVADLQVIPSTRRFDRWSFWRILVWTNPVVVWLLRRRKSVWRGWYEEPVR
jgi:glycosyltransferase involved in cell wall biosynthesis